MGRRVLLGAVALATLVAAVFLALARRADGEPRIARMPSGSRPRWMFENVSAIRRSTDRILEILEAERAGRSDERGTG